ncbi:hypothetical protein ACWCPI_36970 [Streptomyces sp. NPDC001920]
MTPATEYVEIPTTTLADLLGRAWVAGHHSGPALLHRVDDRQGLTDRDFAVLQEWITAGGGRAAR